MNREWERAARAGDIERLEGLRAAGEDVDQLDGSGRTALMICAHEGKERTVRWLIEQGADLDRTAKYGLSALMLAAIAGHDEIVRILAAAGADLDIRGTGAAGFHGRTARELAEDRVEAISSTPSKGPASR